MEKYLDNCYTNQFQFDADQSSLSSSDNYFSTQFDSEHDGCTSIEDKFNNLFDFEHDVSPSLYDYFNTPYCCDFEHDGCMSLDDYFNTQYGFDCCISLDDYFNKQFQFDASCSSLDYCNNQLDLASNRFQSVLEPDTSSTSKIPFMLFLYHETLRYHKTAEQLSESKDQLTKELLFDSMDHITEYDEQELKDINRLKNHIEAVDQIQISRELEAGIDDIDEMNKFHELEAQLELIDF